MLDKKGGSIKDADGLALVAPEKLNYRGGHTCSEQNNPVAKMSHRKCTALPPLGNRIILLTTSIVMLPGLSTRVSGDFGAGYIHRLNALLLLGYRFALIN